MIALYRSQRKRFSRYVIIAAISLGLLACNKPPTVKSGLVGQQFPSVNLVDLGNQTHPFSQYRGKLVVLNVWATWCSPCRRELPSLQRLSEALDPGQFVVIGLSVDDDDHVVREYLKDKNIHFAAFIDKEMKIARDVLKIDSFPMTFVIDQKGKLVKVIVGERDWDEKATVNALQALYQWLPGELF